MTPPLYQLKEVDTMEHIIWSNTEINVADWSDFLQEEYPEVTDPDEQYELCCEMNCEYLDDERANLDMMLPHEIICIADLGLWYGRCMGYKMIESGNIADCLWDGECDYCTWYVDRYNDLLFTGAHHDGRNHYLYRELRDLSDKQMENFLEKLHTGRLTRRDIRRYTTSVGIHVNRAYGW